MNTVVVELWRDAHPFMHELHEAPSFSLGYLMTLRRCLVLNVRLRCQVLCPAFFGLAQCLDVCATHQIPG
jgi:hypothetical protein